MPLLTKTAEKSPNTLISSKTPIRIAAGCWVFVLLLILLQPIAITADTSMPDYLIFKPASNGFISSWLQLGPIELPNPSQSTMDRLATWNPIDLSVLDPPRDAQASASSRWKAHFGALNHIVIKGPRSAVAYFSVVLRSPKAKDIWLATGSDGGIEIRLDGQSVLAKNIDRSAVPDTDLTKLSLKAGDNLLMLKLWMSEQLIWRLYARLLNEDFTPIDNLLVVLPGAGGQLQDAFNASSRLEVERSVDLSESQIDLALRMIFPGGRPVGEKSLLNISFVGLNSPEPIGKEIDLSESSTADLLLSNYQFKGNEAPKSVRVKLGDNTVSANLGFRMQDIIGLHRADADLKAASLLNGLQKSSMESADWRVEHLKSLIENGDLDYDYLTREIGDTEAIAKGLAQGNDPYKGRRGEVQRRGYLSRLDSAYQPYVLYVPPGWDEDSDRQYGLVVSLHGINGSPMKNMLTVMGSPLLEGEDDLKRERHPKKVGPVDYFVLSPNGFGNSGYRAFGEVDVLDAMEQVQQRYRIDPDRIYITGFSMGGIGSASIPLHKPGLFAAAAPLCGYHSLFLYYSLAKSRLKPFEEFLASFSSNKDWALNGKYLPLYVVHGLQDRPMHSNVLVDAYKKLHYDVTYVQPDKGHYVWDDVYKDRWIFKHFSKYKRIAHPREIAFTTSLLRYSRSHWINIDDAADYAKWSEVRAIWDKTNEIKIKTKNVAAISVENDPELRADAPVVINLDGTKFEIDKASESSHFWFHKQNAIWESGPSGECKDLCKRPGLAGPIGDAFFEPLLFVYGANDPGEAALARRLIQELKEPWDGVTIDWPIKADKDVTALDIENYSLVLVGTPGGNSLISKIQGELPIKATDSGIIMGEKAFDGSSICAVFIYPNPLNHNRYVVVHTGPTKQALFYAAHVPRQAPDYFIFDASSWSIKAGRVLGNQRDVLAAGFFDKTWKP